MAGLALGMPIVTNHGPATEPLWQDGIVALVRSEDPAGWVAAAQALETAPDLRRRLSEAGQKAYASYFSIDCTLRLLAAPSPATT